jgi:cytochrome c oxidase subunit 2
MRGHIVVEPEEQFQAWLATQPTFEQTVLAAVAPKADPLAARGRELSQAHGCLGCHSIDGSPSVGPTWRNLYGKTETLVGGATVLVDDAYLRRAIVEPNAEVVQGFPPVMPPSNFSDEDMAAVIAYIKELSGGGTTKN